MIVFFAVLGIASKMKIPEAHTLLEIVRIRYGRSFRECFPAFADVLRHQK
jgi:Na+/proline symporter